jgi:hypothetical protein
VLNDGAWRAEERDGSICSCPLLVAGQVLVGFSLPMFVAALIAAFGDRFRQSIGRLHPRPGMPALSLPERLSITYTRRKEFVGRRFVPRAIGHAEPPNPPPDGSFIALACVAAFRRSSAGP